MRVVFMGTPDFAVPSLDALLSHHDVAAVYTRPDSAQGRGRRISSSPVKERAADAGVPVEQPATLRDPAVVERLSGIGPDAIVVAAFGLILPQDVLDIPAFGCLNVHASLLPRWRGAAPIQRAILAGDEITGVSIMKMEAGLDTGPWCIQVRAPVGDRNAADLTDDLARAGADALVLALDGLERADLVWTGQDESRATYAGKLTSVDVALTGSTTVVDALRRVRASGPSAPCRVVIGGRMLVVLSASPSTSDLRAGEAACSRELEIGLADGAVRLDTVVPEGRAAMSGGAFARGARLPAACTWSAS